MESISVLQIATYLFFIFIVIAFIVKLIGYARMPVHLRWELYPLAGETKRPWGGSYLEESEWWTRPSEGKSFLGEMKFMGREVLFFKEYYHRNKGFWSIVYPFHIGIFLFAGFIVMLFIGAFTMLGGVTVAAEFASIWGRLVYYATLIMGGAGFILGIIGSVSLLMRRIIDKSLQPYARRVDYFNLLFILAVLLTGLLSWAVTDFTFTTAREYARNMITLSAAGNVAPIMAAHIILLALLLAYMPFTNMMHFFAKWFTYHKVRWDDVPNLRGSKLERELGPLLNQPLGWSASHIKPAIQYWSDIAQGDTQQHTAHIKKGVSE